MTKEDRAEQKRLRELDEARRRDEFPEARFNVPEPASRGVNIAFGQIVLEEGVSEWLELRKPKQPDWHTEFGCEDWERISVPLRENLPGLARLIRALVIRYNHLAREANEQARAIPEIQPLLEISCLEKSA